MKDHSIATCPLLCQHRVQCRLGNGNYFTHLNQPILRPKIIIKGFRRWDEIRSGSNISECVTLLDSVDIIKG